MKKILNILLLILGLIITGCSSDKIDYNELIPNSPGSGTLLLNSMNVSVGEQATKSVRAVNTEDFIIRIVDKATNKTTNEWKYSLMPEILTLKAGNYRVEAHAYTQLYAWEKPYFYGSKDITIIAFKNATIGIITCHQKSIKVTVEYDERLFPLMANDCFTEVSIGGIKVNFTKDEERALYFTPTAPVYTLVATFNGVVDNELLSMGKAVDNLVDGNHCRIKFGLNNTDTGGNVADGEIDIPKGDGGITLDTSFEIVDSDFDFSIDEETIPEDKDPEIPGDGGDGEENEDGPSVVGNGFNIKETQLVPAGGMEVIVNIGSEVGVKDIFVEIKSPTLTSEILEDVGLSATFSLANPGALEDALRGLGLPVMEQVVNQNSIVFDVSAFTGLLGIYGPATHRFVITVTDVNNKKTIETLTLQNN